MVKKKSTPSKVRVTLKKSGIGYTVRQKATLKALGFHHLHETVVHEDNAAVRGMLNKISHLVEIETETEEK